jgi:hypothetical protein
VVDSGDFVSRDSTALSTTTIMRSGLRSAPLGGGFTSTPSSIVHGVGAALTRAGKLPPHRPARPRPAAVPDRFAPAPALGPTQSMAGIAGKCSPPHRSEDLGWREDLGWSDDRGFGQREDLGGGVFGQREDLRKASANRKSGKIMANLKIAENYFFLATACRREVRPPGLEPGTN